MKKIFFYTLIIILFFLIKFDLFFKETFINKKILNYKISVIIPCIPRDIKYLDRLLESIKKQTYKCHEIIISLSGITNNESRKLENSYINKYNLPVKILDIKEKKYASENRNRGSLHATGDIISFIDADDVMYPKKLEYVNEYFNKYNPKIFIHGFSNGYKNFEEKEKQIINGEQIYDYIYKKNKNIVNDDEHVSKWWVYPDMHHGHISIPKNLINDIQYREGEKYKRGQDAMFIRDIIKKYGRVKNTLIFLNIPLSQYIPSEEQ